MNVGLIGEGAIGRYVAEKLHAAGIPPQVFLVRPDRLGKPDETTALRVAQVADLPLDIDLMVDCAGHGALIAHGAAILERGIDLITVSLGALADRALERKLTDASQAGNAQLHLASGAIGALDCLQAARVGGLSKVTYIGRKPAAGWRGSPAEEHIDLDGLTTAAPHFEGTARQAATQYPKNANVAASVALAGIGFDRTEVELVADPGASENIHLIQAVGDFGSLSFEVAGKSLPDAPRSSALAAMSVVAAIRQNRDLVRF